MASQTWPFLHCHFIFVWSFLYISVKHTPSFSSAIFFTSSKVSLSVSPKCFFAHSRHQTPLFILSKGAAQECPFSHSQISGCFPAINFVNTHFSLCSLANICASLNLFGEWTSFRSTSILSAPFGS